MKDFIGQQLAIGDTVAYCRYPHREMHSGQIVKLTDKSAMVKTGKLVWNHKDRAHNKVEVYRCNLCEVVKLP